MAISVGKKTINTGVNKVPKPNPEKKVRIAMANAAKEIRRISTYLQKYGLR